MFTKDEIDALHGQATRKADEEGILFRDAIVSVVRVEVARRVCSLAAQEAKVWGDLMIEAGQNGYGEGMEDRCAARSEILEQFRQRVEKEFG